MEKILNHEKAEYLIFNLSQIDLKEVEYEKANIYGTLSSEEVDVNEIIKSYNKEKIVIENTFIITDNYEILSNQLIMEFFNKANIIAINFNIPEVYRSFLNLQIGSVDRLTNVKSSIKFCNGDEINTQISKYLEYLINPEKPVLKLEHSFVLDDAGNLIIDDFTEQIYELEIINLDKSYGWIISENDFNVFEIIKNLELNGRFSILLNHYSENKKTSSRLAKDLLFESEEKKLVEKKDHFIIESLKPSNYVSVESFSYEGSVRNIFVKNDGTVMGYGTSRNRHTYLYNIKNNLKMIKLSANTRHSINFNDKMLVNRTQKQYNLNVNLQSYDSVNYTQTIIGEPRKLLVTFPGFNTSSNVHYPVSLLKSMHKKLDDIAIVATQDFSEILGTYMVYNQYGEVFDQKIIGFIKNKLSEFNLTEDDLIIYGNSKGGTIALRFSKTFRNARVIADAPQLDLKAKTLNSLVLNSFDELTYELNYLVDYIKSDNPNVFYAFSLIDIDSNCNIDPMDLGCNYILYEKESHGIVIRKNLPLAINLIMGNDLKHRTYKWGAEKIEYAINCKYDFVYKLNTNNKWVAKAIYDFKDIQNEDDLIIAKAHNIFYIKADLTVESKNQKDESINKLKINEKLESNLEKERIDAKVRERLEAEIKSKSEVKQKQFMFSKMFKSFLK